LLRVYMNQDVIYRMLLTFEADNGQTQKTFFGAEATSVAG